MERLLRDKLPDGRFIGVTDQHSRFMSRVRGKGNRTTELRLRMELVRHRVHGWLMHPSDVAGKPDFYFPAERVAIFVDGCFWHGCPKCGHVPSKHRLFWAAKIARNRERDAFKNRQLRALGVAVHRFWECELHQSRNRIITEIQRTRSRRNRKMRKRA